MEQKRTRTLLLAGAADMCRALREQLELHGAFRTETADTMQAFEAFARDREQRFDAILLDDGLPDLDARTARDILRHGNAACPVIMLTDAAGNGDDVPADVDGIGDYIAKPFRLHELLARLRAQLRRHDAGADMAIDIGPYHFRPTAKMLIDTERGRQIRLTEKEAAILIYLHRADGREISRQMLLGEVWGYHADITTHTLETHIYRLRRKIEANPSRAEILITEPGGYRLVRS